MLPRNGSFLRPRPNKHTCTSAKTARSRCRWSVSGGRACGTLRECHRLVYGASERLVGARDCSAVRVSAPLLLKLFCNQSCGHKQVDMLSLLLGRSTPGRQLVKVFSASLVRIVRDDTSQLVVAPAQRVVSMLVPLDMLQW